MKERIQYIPPQSRLMEKVDRVRGNTLVEGSPHETEANEGSFIFEEEGEDFSYGSVNLWDV